MTGYGKAEVLLEAGKVTLEIRTLNSKNADISVKSQFLPKDKEIIVRKLLSDRLQRGTIDFFLNFEANETAAARPINKEAVLSYLSQVDGIAKEYAGTGSLSDQARAFLLGNILRLPDVVDAKKAEVITDENWPAVEKGLDEALDMLDAFRIREGVALYKDITSRVALIEQLYDEVEKLEGERIETVRAKLLKAIDELTQKPDQSRFEQELIFYLEKFDINEEKVRLRQHCKYFMETIDNEPNPGKKLGFIIQEMGREINTTGSKANHAGIQKLVVRMKDELEKIREQSMNVL
ncbi:MAG: YicC family protein [Bacteroidales bacterium]|nr:YicC family protein [Bacteroidales bacterium]